MWLIGLSPFPHLVWWPIVIPSITLFLSAFLSFMCSPSFNPCSPSLLFLSAMLPLSCPLQACCCGDGSKGDERTITSLTHSIYRPCTCLCIVCHVNCFYCQSRSLFFSPSRVNISSSIKLFHLP